MTKELLNEIENDYWNEKADPIDMTEVFDLANRALEQQPCEDCISREAAIKIFGEVHPLDYNKQSYIANIKKLPSVTPQQPRDCKTCKHSDKGNCAGTEECHECMWDSKYEQQPCEEQEPKIGHWVVVSSENNVYICECSECKDEVWFKDAGRKWNYCSNCGAKMEGEIE